jgi:hypothetical protein
MKKFSLVISFVSLGGFALMTVGADRVAAQGPAGAGASGSTQQSSQSSQSSHSSHSLNPIKWIKKDKDSKNSADSNASRSDVEKKLTPKLQAEGVLPANSNATEACTPFAALNECLAALHASHNLGMDFNCLRANVTGVLTNANMSGCKGAIGDKAQSLNKAIHELKPEANAKEQTKNAEQQAKDDLKNLGS